MTEPPIQPEIERARYTALLAASLDAIVVMDHEGHFLEFNRAAEAIFGYRREEVIGRPLADFLIPPSLRERHRQGLARYLTARAGPVVNQRIELPALRADGQEFPVEIAIVPVSGEEPPVFVGFIRDITERKAAEDRQHLLMSESTHRIRNMLTVVHSIVSLTLAGDRPLTEARTILSRRINALSRSHATLTAGVGAGASLRGIVEQEIEGFSDRAEAAGPNIALKASAGLTFALILHELATNAAKHGALSAASGKVTIRWTTDGARFTFDWREQGGPPASAPSRSGFGRAVLEQMAAHEFKSTPVILFDPAGLHYRLDAPLAMLIKGE
jgi:PAS domain S-box-containing protein